MIEPLVTARSIEMSFGGTRVLHGVDLDLFPGEVHSIVGENGAGKSTLAKLIAGVYRPSGGEIFRDGSICHFRNPREALAAGIALVHQEPLTFPELSVAENIFIGNAPKTRFGTIDWRELDRRAREIMSRVGLDMLANSPVGGLSVAKQQMVELASALSHNAKVIILDETTASLTPKEVAELFSIVHRLREEGCALAFVSHKLNEVFEISDRITVLRDGAKVAEVSPGQSSIREVVKMMVGRDVESGHKIHAFSRSKPILTVESLQLNVDGPSVSFEVSPGEIVGIAGLVGAGRTEIAQALVGVTKPFGGEVRFGGAAVRFRNPADALASGMVLVPEDRQHDGLLLPISIAQNMTLPILQHLSKIWTRSQNESKIGETWISRLGIACRGPMQPIRELSGGNQQKVVLAKAQLCEPKLLIVDEPTRGVDIGAKTEVHRLLRNLAEAGMAIIAISSDLPEVLHLSDRVLVMRNQTIVAEFASEDASEEKIMFAATGQSQ